MYIRIKDDRSVKICIIHVSGATSEKIARYFKKKCNFKISFRTNNNLREWFENNKVHKNEKSCSCK